MLRVAEAAFRSDPGRQRTANEDSYYARPPLFAVADGMGGAQAGEVASRLAAESFEPTKRGEESPEAFLRSIAETANERIHNLSQQDSTVSGMGTTLTAAMLEGHEVTLAHVGDSRAYLFRDGELKLLTSDHSLVEELRRQGRLTDEQAEDHPQRSIITRALGPESEVEVDTMTQSARPGDIYLLCSDGLTTMVREDRIAEVLSSARHLDTAVEQLVREANEGGGRDNITVVAFRLEEAVEGAEVEQPTLIGPSAEEAGMTAATVGAAETQDSEAVPARPGPPTRGAAPTRRRLRTAAKVLAVLIVIAGIGAAAVYGARQVYFLGTDEGGRVALYRGLPYELPFGIELYSEIYSAPVTLAAVPSDRHDSVTDHELRSHDDAVSLLTDLEAAATEASESEAQGQGQQGNRQQGQQGNRQQGQQGGQGGERQQGRRPGQRNRESSR
ncbi:MAG TPA: Stp1/IreP family PP2C-type Ser/Thr phosphatase [Solirubrobacterales bacterium]|nr:Stp1/IreP family PP2C-type Ser/Thr phosphatase [Solirubrobacterales bacterium]